MQKCIQVNHLVKRYKHFQAVDNISFHVEQGSTFAFLGVNGAGKSTTMNMIATLLKPSSGTIDVHGYQNDKHSKQIRSNVGFVFQDNVLDEECSVYDNLKYRGALYSLTKKEIQKRIEELSSTFELQTLLHKPYKHCSGGQKRLVMIARALIHNPKLIILDEPTTGLDPNIRKKVWEHLKKYQEKQNVTIFFSSHYIEEAMNANQICIINKGKIMMIDTPENMIDTFGKKKLTMLIDDETIRVDVQSPHQAIQILNQKQKNMKAFECANASLEDIFLHCVQKVGSV